MKIILVDDEQIVLDGISTILEADKDRFQILAQCDNAVSALEAVARERPNVVITDIRMNGMTGLDLAEKIHELDENILVIMLTGYPDFVFAQKAIKLGVFDYLVKPTRYMDIIKCLNKAEDKLRRLAIERESKTGLIYQMESNREALIGKLLQEIMTGYVTNESEINKRAIQLELALPCFLVINIRFENWRSTFDKDIADKFSLNYALRNIFIEKFNRFEKLFVALENIDNFVLLLQITEGGTDIYGEVSSCVGICLRQAMEQLEARLAIGLSTIQYGLHNLREAYNQSIRALDIAIKSKTSFACFGQEQEIGDVYSPAIRKALSYIHEHYCEEISLKSVANEVFLNAWYFSELFKKEVGKHFTDYVLNLRIAKAKNLIENKNLPLYQVAGMVGINGAGYFSQIFKRFTGLTPKEYRKRYNKMSGK